MSVHSGKQFAFAPLQKADDLFLRGRRSLTGFTFVEVLLGLLIFSLIALVLYSTFFSGLEVQRRADAQGAMSHELKMALDSMARELEQAVPLTLDHLAPDLKSLDGRAQEVVFWHVDKDDAIKRVSYYLKDQDQARVRLTLVAEHLKNNVTVVNTQSAQLRAKVLMRKEMSFRDAVSSHPPSPLLEEVVLENIQPDSFSFQYAYLDPGQGEPTLSWKKEWTYDYLPSGIRIQLTLAPWDEKGTPAPVLKEIYNPCGSWGEMP